ncbi:MAG: aldehyde dehydrogenase [Chloroflexi bacterium]|nr:aldehyde dehydrogenase [Chloroflexota bacterium]
MDIADIRSLHALQKQYFTRQGTKPLAARIQILKTLKQLILRYESRLLRAMQQDLRKPETEAATAEIWYVIKEIDSTLRQLKGWMRPRRTRTPLLHFRASSYIYSEPYGQTLIISPWNYPFLLLFSPLLGALAAGNVAILKPSELAPHTAAVIEEMINSTFESGLVHVVFGDAETARALLSLPFDYIFFTGGTQIGKLVLKAAAEYLTPVTLELGGKSPAIVDQSADLEVAASRLVWGKFLNAGQTCIAPDYLLVHHSVHADLVRRLSDKIKDYYGPDPEKSPDLARIINRDHFNRLAALLDPQKVVHGGQVNAQTRYIAPTLLDGVTPDDPVMREEIFGPILPVISYETLEEAIRIVQLHPNPLALYIFTREADTEKRIIQEIPFGGGCVNDVISHMINEEIPFGGRGASGMGAYHGKHTFDTFSHQKSILRRANRPDLPLRYPPYRIENRVMRFIFSLASWLY